MAGDASQASQIEQMFQQVREAFGGLDILVNNGGIQTWKPLLELAESNSWFIGTITRMAFLSQMSLPTLYISPRGASRRHFTAAFIAILDSACTQEVRALYSRIGEHG